MSESSVFAEVRKFIADKIAHGETVVVNFLAHEIVMRKADISGGDVEFYRACAYTHIRDVVKRCVGKYEASPVGADRQLVLDGFQYLQKAYSVPRSGQTVLVPVDQLTDDEVEARADELIAMAKGCREHAKELRNYALERKAAA